MIDSGWKFNDVVQNIETLRSQYKGFLVSFSLWERPKRIQLCRDFKKQIYSLRFEEYRKNLIWKYINDEIEYEELLQLGGLDNGRSNKTND